MSYIILGFALLALFHFIYEGILAPSFRMKLEHAAGSRAGNGQKPGAPREGRTAGANAGYVWRT
jgi:hypothetical protein